MQLKSHKVPRYALISILGGGRGILQLKSQSVKICLNFNFWGEGYSATEKSQCQNLPKFQFLGWGGGYSATEKSQSAKICLNFNFGGGILQLKSQSAKICLNFNLGGGGILQLKSQSMKICLNFNFGGVFCN